MEKRNQSRIPTQKRSKQRVETILNAATDCIQELGFSQLKMKDISSRAQVSPSSVYQYFPDKEAIIAALSELYTEQILSVFASYDDDVRDLDEAAAFLESQVSGYYDLLEQQPAMTAILANLAIDPALERHHQAINIARARALNAKLYQLLRGNAIRAEYFCFWAQHLIHHAVCFSLQQKESPSCASLELTCNAVISAMSAMNSSAEACQHGYRMAAARH